MPESLDDSPPSERPSVLGREGILVLMSTGLAYAAALAYEGGFAFHFGYPYWLIDLDVGTVAVAWMSLAVAFGFAYVVTLVALAIVPATAVRTLRALYLFNLSRMAGSTFLVALLGAWLVGEEPVIGAILMVLFGLGSIVTTHLSFDFYRSMTSESKSTLERLEEAVDWWNRPEEETEALEKSALGLASRRSTLLGILAYGMAVVVLLIGLLLPAFALGEQRFHTETVFLVSDSPAALVALRRYGDKMIAASLTAEDASAVSDFRIIPVADDSVSWSRQRIGPLRGAPVCERSPKEALARC